MEQRDLKLLRISKNKMLTQMHKDFVKAVYPQHVQMLMHNVLEGDNEIEPKVRK